MKYEILGVAIEEFIGLTLKMYSFLLDNIENKKAKGVNKNVAARISDNEYKYILLNKKCTRHSMNRIQSKEYKRGTDEITKLSLFYFDGKIYIQNNVDTLALGTRVNTVIP